MIFNSYLFILAFLPITVIGYYQLNKRYNTRISSIYLIGMSFIFCGYFNISSLIMLLVSIICNYGLTQVMFRRNKQKKSVHQLVCAGVIANVLGLVYFKYADFIIDNIIMLQQEDIQSSEVIWILGISYFTFSQISFLIDFSKKMDKPVPFVEYVLYITYFPKLTSGPIGLYENMRQEFHGSKRRIFDSHLCNQGLYLFTLGLAKKVLIADTLSGMVAIGYDQISLLTSFQSLVVILAYTMQIYFDFSGYCDMAVGVSKMLNIELPINFDSPYKAVSVTEFWNRWHITLSKFFTKYVYIPLGGNRNGLICTIRNTMIIFVISGIWHGANWTFLMWGLLHGVAVSFEKILLYFRIKVPRVIGYVGTFLIVNIGWVYFRADSIAQGNELLSNLVTGIDRAETVQLSTSLFELAEFRIIARMDISGVMSNNMVGVLFLCVIILVVFLCKNTNQLTVDFQPTKRRLYLSVLLLVWCIVSLAGMNTFVYFNF